ncbi:ParB/RepB/Spo0J family partition protein [Tolypothrix sp. VBCCA 56010]|uniref:ParB/RepB/Spo0J family partition protein n=1 Tax=Tolypothrix sp. VBCCA 56010 TaxID=3137731 RepID=UPI003D7EACF1
MSKANLKTNLNIDDLLGLQFGSKSTELATPTTSVTPKESATPTISVNSKESVTTTTSVTPKESATPNTSVNSKKSATPNTSVTTTPTNALTTSNPTPNNSDTGQNPQTSQTLPLELICLTKKQQPRRYFDPKAHASLVSSIEQHGILQPILVRPIDGEKYELVAGERRLRAAEDAGLNCVPVVIKELDDTTAFLVAVVENIQREDLNVVDETEGILQILSIKLGCSVEDVAPILHNLQQQRKDISKAAKNNASNNPDSPNNDIGKTKPLQPDSPNNDIRRSEWLQPDFPNNDIGKTKPLQPDYPNNDIGRSEQLQSQSDNPTDLQLQIVEAVFKALGFMTWESFTCNRLPLLNLKSDILLALRNGEIEYTKAKLINKIKDQSQRIDFLEQAIKQNWSVAETKEKIQPLLAITSTATAFPSHLKSLWDKTIPKVKKANIWNDANKQKRLEELLGELQSLIEEQQAS